MQTCKFVLGWHLLQSGSECQERETWSISLFQAVFASAPALITVRTWSCGKGTGIEHSELSALQFRSGTPAQVNAGSMAPITAVQFGAYQAFQQAICKVTGAHFSDVPMGAAGRPHSSHHGRPLLKSNTQMCWQKDSHLRACCRPQLQTSARSSPLQNRSTLRCRTWQLQCRALIWAPTRSLPSLAHRCGGVAGRADCVGSGRRRLQRAHQRPRGARHDPAAEARRRAGRDGGAAVPGARARRHVPRRCEGLNLSFRQEIHAMGQNAGTRAAIFGAVGTESACGRLVCSLHRRECDICSAPHPHCHLEFA